MRLSAENLACERGGRTVFSNQNFTLGSGEFLQLTGPNGAGKSSLLRLLANLSEPSHGKISLEGGAPDLTPGQQAHYIAHSDASKSALTVTENLKFWRDFIGGGDLDRRFAAPSILRPSPTIPWPCFPPARNAALPLQDWLSSPAPSGCWMNPASAWMKPRKNCSSPL